MEWYSFRKKRPRVGEMILVCISTGKEKSAVYRCHFEKFEHTFKCLISFDAIHLSNLVSFSGDFFCNHSNYVTLSNYVTIPLDPYNFHWARLE